MNAKHYEAQAARAGQPQTSVSFPM